MDNNIFIAFDNKKTAACIAKILVSNGSNVVSVSRSASELMHSLSYYHGGVIITGCTFGGITMEKENLGISDDFTFIIIGNRAQLDNFPEENAFKLSTPLQKNDLICSVDMLMAMDTDASFHRQNAQRYEQKLILRAKHMLIDRYSMTEAQAHRYMQKKSMDTGRKLYEIAVIILGI